MKTLEQLELIRRGEYDPRNNGHTPGVSEDDSITGKTLAEFSARQAAVASMRERFTGLSCATPQAYEETRLALAELRTFRGEIEDRCKILKADAQRWIKSVNAESDRLIEEAKAIEAPLKAIKESVDEEKKRKKTELEAAQKERLEAAARKKVEEEAAKRKAEQDARDEANRKENERLIAERARIAAENAKIAAENAKLAAEREKIEAERQASEWRIALARRDEEEKQRAAREELERQKREFQDKVDAAERAEREKREAAEKAERDRQATIVAEQQRKEREDREAKEASERQAAEAARLELLRPDIDRVLEFGAKLAGLIDQAPVVQSEDAKLLIMASKEWLSRIVKKLTQFGS